MSDARKAHDEIDQLRMSFAVGNVGVEAPGVPRAAVTHALSDTGRETDSHLHRFAGAIRQFDLILAQLKSVEARGRFSLSPQMIAELHAVGGFDRGFRSGEVVIAGSKHAPVPPQDIGRHIDELCGYINANWHEDSATHLAAYALWALNWIHPFADGNGRTARAVAYLVLCARAGGNLGGTPTIVEQVARNRARYVDALRVADVSREATGRADVSELEALLDEMLLRQLEAQAALSTRIEEDIAALVARRIKKSSDWLKRFSGEEALDVRLWSINDLLVLQVSPPSAIEEAERRLHVFGDPFPRLFAPDDALASIRVEEGSQNEIHPAREYETFSKHVFSLGHNTAVAIESPAIRVDRERVWHMIGTLYVIRYGRALTPEMLPEVLEGLIARHVMLVRIESGAIR